MNVYNDVAHVYPFCASKIPAITASQRKAIQSPNFQLKQTDIQNDLSEGSERGICTVPRGQITSIDSDGLIQS